MTEQAKCTACGHQGDHDDNGGFCKVCGQAAYPCQGCFEGVSEPDSFCERCRTEKLHKGLTREQLSRAFDMVQNAEHWKLEIDAYIGEEFLGEVSAAVEFYAGGGLRVAGRNSDGLLRVEAPGYFALIGA